MLDIPNVEISVQDPFPGSDHKMATCSFSLRGKPPLPVSIKHTVSSHYISTRWNEIPGAVQTIDWANFVSSLDPGKEAHDHHIKLLFTINRLFPANTQHKPRKISKLCQLQMKPLKAQKIVNKTRRFPLLMQANSPQQEFLVES